MDTLDARGLSCPEPVVMISQAMASKADSYRMIVDAVAARENVTRYAQSQGYTVLKTTASGRWILPSRHRVAVQVDTALYVLCV